VLKLWIDQNRAGRQDFGLWRERPKGLIIDKKATFIIERAASTNAQTQMASFNFVEPVSAVRIWFLA